MAVNLVLSRIAGLFLMFLYCLPIFDPYLSSISKTSFHKNDNASNQLIRLFKNSVDDN